MTAEKRIDSQLSRRVRRILPDSDYEAAVAAFIRTRGVTRCPTACVVPTQATIGAADRAVLRLRAAEAETRRLAEFGRLQLTRAMPQGRGNPRIAEAAAKGRDAHKAVADYFAASLRPIVDGIRAAGTTSLAAIAEELNSRGIGAPRGGKWRGSAVKRLLDRAGDD